MMIRHFLFCSVILALPVWAAENQVSQPNQHLRIIQTEELRYPLNMKADGVRLGTVRVVFHVDAAGSLVDYLIVAYTKKPFADEVARVLPKWKFEPERANGSPVDSVVQLDLNFRVDGLMVINRLVSDLPRTDISEGQFEYQARSLKDLDRIPTPINVVKPVYPKEWADQGVSGSVVVDFYIDEQGLVRLPAAMSGSSSDLAGQAVSAVAQWKFDPPTYKGRPVLVHVQQRFSFN